MSETDHTPGASDIPPIVLFVDDGADTREMYSVYFESSGVWAATAADPQNALDMAADLEPNLIVADITFGSRADGVDLVHALRETPATSALPIVVLSDREQLPAGIAQEADLVLVKPVMPDVLLSHARRLIAKSAELRSRSEAVRAKTRALVDKSHDLMVRGRRAAAALDGTARGCPSCGHRLEWVERGRIGEIEYDYYHWCAQGCGLYCYDRPARSWVKLA